MAHTKTDVSGLMFAGKSELPMRQPVQTDQERRLAALRAAQGIWKNRTDIPKDGVEYQEQMRGEWA